jgi:hypothetical protein
MTASLFTPFVVLAGLLASRTQAIYWQLAFCLFGAAAALEMPALGGGTITPSVLFMPFLFVRAYAENYGQRYARRVPTAAFWLGCAVLFGVIGAIVMPRMFAGRLQVVALDWAANSPLSPIRPTSGNVTQSGYAIGGVVAFASMHALLSQPGRMQSFRDAVLLLASLNCAAAFLNLAQYHLGVPDILQYVRTAYAVFGTYEVPGTGLVRLHGTFSETSAFSTFSLTLFAFCFSLWLHNVRPFYTGILALMLVTFLLISTSTTALVGLALYLLMLGFVLMYRGYMRGAVPRIGLLIAGLLLGVVVIGSGFVLETQVAEKLQDFLKVTIVDKAESDSGLTRAQWNSQAWSNFLDTWGLGVGIGTIRASSFFLVLLSNLGALGTLCYLTFLKQALAGTAAPDQHRTPVAEAARQALLASLSGALLSAAVFDLGIAFYAYAAAACSGAFEASPLGMQRDTSYGGPFVPSSHERQHELARAGRLV